MLERDVDGNRLAAAKSLHRGAEKLDVSLADQDILTHGAVVRAARAVQGEAKGGRTVAERGALGGCAVAGPVFSAEEILHRVRVEVATAGDAGDGEDERAVLELGGGGHLRGLRAGVLAAILAREREVIAVRHIAGLGVARLEGLRAEGGGRGGGEARGGWERGERVVEGARYRRGNARRGGERFGASGTRSEETRGAIFDSVGTRVSSAHLEGEEVRERLVHAHARDKAAQLYGRRHGAAYELAPRTLPWPRGAALWCDVKFNRLLAKTLTESPRHVVAHGM